MLELHERIAATALPALEHYGFVLAGGYAITMHGFGDRPSADVDLFTADTDPEHFTAALAVLHQVLADAGFQVTDLRIRPLFADLHVREPATGLSSDLQLGMNPRVFPPPTLTIGPVLDVRDAIGAKMSALYGRGEARDFIDIATVIESARFTCDQVVALGDAQEAQPMDRTILREQFRAAGRWTVDDYDRYGVDSERRERIIATFTDWAESLHLQGQPGGTVSWERVGPPPPVPPDPDVNVSGDLNRDRLGPIH
mgnify:CR=1 FL=1